MLILSRRVNETILIGDDIQVTVTQVDGRSGAVRIGVKAPREMAVDREEVRQRKARDKLIICAP
jgi:carbon storage regulator